MKKVLLCAIVLPFIVQSVMAQSQQGYVKTRGKLAADGKSVIEGKRLNNAVVTIENRTPVKSGNNGTFSFVLPAGTNYYRVQSVELKGYVLADPDALRQQHTYSKNIPLILVLEDKAQREADLEAARKSVRNTMKREIRKKQDEIDSLLEVNAITQAKYDSLTRDFWEYRQSSENLVNEMAERYVSIDYDQLDDFNRQVQSYIEHGELLKADSMIRSKGSLQERYNKVKQYEATNNQRETEIKKEQEALDKSRQFTQKEKEDLSNDLYRQYLIFAQQPLFRDSARYCLKLRADLDTTNLENVCNYADFALERDALKYYFICLRAYQKQEDTANIAAIQLNIGLTYSGLHDYAQCDSFYLQSLENYEKLYEKNPEQYRYGLAKIQTNLGVFCNDHNYVNYSRKYFEQALKNAEILFAGDSSNHYRLFLSIAQNNMGGVSKSEKYLLQALKNRQILLDNNPENEYYRGLVASSQESLGQLYQHLKKYDISENYFKMALETYEKLADVAPDNNNGLAWVQLNLGYLYFKKEDYLLCEKYYKLSQKNFETLYAKNPDVYRPSLAWINYYMMGLYAYTDELEKYDTCMNNALELYRILYTLSPFTYKQSVTNLQNYAISRLLQKGMIDDALTLARENIALIADLDILFYSEIEYRAAALIAECLEVKARQYIDVKEYDLAASAVNEAFGYDNIPEDSLVDLLGEILLLQGKDQEALKIWNNKLEEYPYILEDNPEGTSLYKKLKAKGLIK